MPDVISEKLGNVPIGQLPDVPSNLLPTDQLAIERAGSGTYKAPVSKLASAIASDPAITGPVAAEAAVRENEVANLQNQINTEKSDRMVAVSAEAAVRENAVAVLHAAVNATYALMEQSVDEAVTSKAGAMVNSAVSAEAAVRENAVANLQNQITHIEQRGARLGTVDHYMASKDYSVNIISPGRGYRVGNQLVPQGGAAGFTAVVRKVDDEGAIEALDLTPDVGAVSVTWSGAFTGGSGTGAAGSIATSAATVLPKTVAGIQAMWGKTASMDDFANVRYDDNQTGRFFLSPSRYIVESIFEDEITWGFDIHLDLPDRNFVEDPVQSDELARNLDFPGKPTTGTPDGSVRMQVQNYEGVDVIRQHLQDQIDSIAPTMLVTTSGVFLTTASHLFLKTRDMIPGQGGYYGVD